MPDDCSVPDRCVLEWLVRREVSNKENAIVLLIAVANGCPVGAVRCQTPGLYVAETRSGSR